MGWVKRFALMFTLMATYTSTIQAAIEREFAGILTLSEAEKRMINTPVPYSYSNYLRFAYIASGVPENQIARYKGVVDKITTALASAIAAKQVSDAPEKRAEFILEWLHQNFFGRYAPHQTRVDEMLESRTFNCVSSSVLYNAICRKFGIHVTGVIVPDHAFSQLKLPKMKIDIETTIRYGFDPTSKKELFNEFGKLTGFVYVPQKNYRKRSEVGDKEMIALIYSNRYKDLSAQRRYAQAAKALYVGWRLAGDLPPSLNTWENALGNYIIGLNRAKRFADALYVIDEANRRFTDLKQPSELRRTVYTNWSYHTLQAKQYDEAIRILKGGLALFPRDAKLTQNLKAAYLEKAQALGKEKRLAEAQRTIEEGHQTFPREEKFRIMEINLYIQEADKLPMDEAVTFYQKAVKKYPRDKMLQEAFAFLYIDPAQKLGAQGRYEAAIQLLDQSEKHLPTSPKIDKAKAIVYNNWGLSLAKRKDFAKAKLVIERGLAISSADRALRNNWDSVLLEWADVEFRSNHFDQAVAILQEGLRKTQSHGAMFRQMIETYYNDSAIKLLRRGEIQKGIERLQGGLKILPRSKVMKNNLKLALEQKK